MGIKSLEDLERAFNGEEIESEGDTSTETTIPEDAVTDTDTVVESHNEEVAVEEPKTEPVVESHEEQTEEVYVPTMSYKVKDEERMFDDRFKDIIKSKEDEDFLRDLYTRADGLDTYKEKLGATEQTIAQLQGNLTQAADYYKVLGAAAESGDMDKVVRTLKLSDDAILNYAMRLVEESELPEDKRREVQDARQLRYKQEEMEEQNAYLAQQIEEIQAATLAQQNDALVRYQTEQVNSAIGKYGDLNTTLANAGINMFDLVVAEGHKDFLQTGQEPNNYSELVDRVASRFTQIMPKAPVVDVPPQQNTTKAEPVPASIPKITGDPSSPVDRRVVSLEQLQAEFNKDYGQPTFY